MHAVKGPRILPPEVTTVSRITTIQDHFPKIPRIETRTIEFAYESDDYTNFNITA